MPTYEYVCTSCGTHTEAVQSFSDDPLTTCDACGGPLRKVFGNVGIVLKGSGFYKTDSRSTGSNGSSPTKSNSESAGSGGSGSTDAGSASPSKDAGKESGKDAGGSSSTTASSGSSATPSTSAST